MTEPYADDQAFAAAMNISPTPTMLPPNPPQFIMEKPEPPEEEQEDEAREEVPEFDPRWRDAFSGLLYVGALSSSFEVYGHRFTIATPTMTEMLQIGQVIEPFQKTVMAEVAFQTARVAAYLSSIDGRDLPRPISNDPKETALHQRFQWVNDTLKRPVINKIHDKTFELDAQVEGVLEAMGKA